jgi:putative addiction module component (TIGR02574 family)
MILETIPAIQALTVEEKLLLAGEIWREALTAAEPISSEMAALLDERIAAYRDRPDEVLTTEKVTENLRSLKARLSAERK